MAEKNECVVKVPLFTWFAGYHRSWLRGDMIAGVTVWAVLVPEALAYAQIAGVSPVVGLYAAPGALILYAAFGSSRHLVTGPMAATAALSAAAVGELAAGGSDAFVQLTITLALVVGILALAAGVLRLGFLASFISEPVLKGFVIGLALTIMVGQLPKLFGIEKSEGAFFQQLWGLLGDLGDTSGPTLVVGVLSLLLVVGLKRYLPVVPGALVAVLLGILAVNLFDLDGHGVAIVGHIESGLPSFGLPDVAAHSYLDLSALAVGVMLIGFAEGLGAAKTYAAKNHYEIDANRELIGLGAANLASGLSSGMVVNGSLSKTAVNGSAGARSQFSSLVVAALAVVTLLFLTGLFEDLPEATLAAIVVAALIELVDIEALIHLYRFHTRGAGRAYALAARPDFAAAGAALLGVLVFDTVPGLFIGIAVSLLLLLYRASRPHIAVLGRDSAASGRWSDIQRDPVNERVPGVVVLRPESGLFFANADAVRDAIRAHAAVKGTKAVVLDAETVPSIDVTAVSMLVELAGDLRRDGIELVLARDVAAVRGLVQLGEGDTPLRTYPTVRAAIAALEK
ncbi:SulP family inorganic anion transporter [Kribbella sp. NPDC051586]|uniref:SulP family inorganic anion transporter n=1 Tax=Kribbella sp. NPDC051586 TaxID=3364118 RepID=UPI0037A0DD43